jgi:hypothetical protein
MLFVVTCLHRVHLRFTMTGTSLWRKPAWTSLDFMGDTGSVSWTLNLSLGKTTTGCCLQTWLRSCAIVSAVSRSCRIILQQNYTADSEFVCQLVRKAEDENFPPLEKEAEDNREASSALQSPAAAPSSVLGADVRTSHCQNKSDPPAVGPTGGPKDLTQVEGWGNKNLQLHVKNGNEEGKQSGTKKLKKVVNLLLPIPSCPF